MYVCASKDYAKTVLYTMNASDSQPAALVADEVTPVQDAPAPTAAAVEAVLGDEGPKLGEGGDASDGTVVGARAWRRSGRHRGRCYKLR
jgi:hypothetical protein